LHAIGRQDGHGQDYGRPWSVESGFVIRYAYRHSANSGGRAAQDRDKRLPTIPIPDPRPLRLEKLTSSLPNLVILFEKLRRSDICLSILQNLDQS
jgi:hypothetical protein